MIPSFIHAIGHFISSCHVMDAPTILASADSSKGNFGDAIDIGLDVDHPVPVAADAFPAVTITSPSLGGYSRTMKAIETVTRSQKRRTRREMERHLASVQES
nr:hypothetical protein [Tanacetum cinerariifolium]